MRAWAPGLYSRGFRSAADAFARAGRVVVAQVVATPPRAYAVVALALGLLFATTVVLAGRFHEVRNQLAREHYEHGRALARAGEPAEAIPWLRASLAHDRRNTTVRLVLATTLLEAGRAREAGSYLVDVLRAKPTDGLANLTRARVSRAMGVPEDAEQYYRRAIYGEWPEASGRRLDARFELIELLLERGQQTRAVSELTVIEAEHANDVDVARRLGRRFLDAGSADEAARVLRRVVAARPADGDAWAWLSDAEFRLGRYASAVTAADRALAIRPDPQTQDRFATASAVLSLDPTARRLRATERRTRAATLLARSLAVLDACIDPAEGAASAEVDAARTRAAAALEPRRAGAVPSDEKIDLAELLWQVAVSTCPASRGRDPVLARVMDVVTAGEAAQ